MAGPFCAGNAFILQVATFVSPNPLHRFDLNTLNTPQLSLPKFDPLHVPTTQLTPYFLIDVHS